MDAERFDTLTRSLTAGYTRRGLTRILGALALSGPLGVLGLAETAAKRKKKKKKKKGAPAAVCTPDCRGKSCGNNGCGGSCGTCEGRFVCSNTANGGTCVCRAGHDACEAGASCCSDCQTCDAGRDVCLMKPESDTAACDGGQCCGGACCPATCQCGANNSLADALAREFAESQGLPYPACFAKGTGQACGCGGSPCPAGTTCYQGGSSCLGVCAGPCPGVDYPAPAS